MKYVLLLLACLALPARAASFDCARAATPDERAICDDAPLSDLDSLTSSAFDQTKQSAGSDRRAELTGQARALLRQRRVCGADKSCILLNYVTALLTWQSYGATAAMPSWISAPAIAGNRPLTTSAFRAIGQCASARIAKVTPRLEGDDPPTPENFDGGTQVEYTNGMAQVSYAREPALLNSKPGDAVLMCLVWAPRDCPPHDTRGRTYTATNVRTGETWTLPDSAHMCGGA